MTFSEFQNSAWTDHASNAVQVSERIPSGIKLIDQAEQIPLMANLIAHVFGEHLGRWSDGAQLLQSLKLLPSFTSGSEGDKAVARLTASLEVASGQRQSLSAFSKSDQIRVLAVAASAMCEQKNAEEARSLFLEAINLASVDLAKEDPANRAMAVTGNNLAASLEEKTLLSESETALMLLAAQTALKFWQVAGTWLQVERAEYRVAKSYLRASEVAQAAHDSAGAALKHARRCLEICEINKAPALEFFFGNEVLAVAEKANRNPGASSAAIAQMKKYFGELSDDDKSWCRATLDKLE